MVEKSVKKHIEHTHQVSAVYFHALPDGSTHNFLATIKIPVTQFYPPDQLPCPDLDHHSALSKRFTGNTKWPPPVNLGKNRSSPDRRSL